MDLADQLAAVWARRVLVLAVGVAVAAVVFVWRSSAPEVFEASATIQVRPPASVTSDTASQVDFYADTVAGLVTSQDLVAAALDSTGRDDDPNDVVELVTAESGTQPGFVEMTASSATPQEAATLVDALVTVVSERVTADQASERDLLNGLIAGVERERDQLPADATGARAALTQVQRSLESALESGTGVATWQVTTVADAEAPTDPASPVPLRDAMLAFLVTVILVGEAIVIRRSWKGNLSARDPAGDAAAILSLPAVTVSPADGPGALAPLLGPLADASRVTVIDRGQRPRAQTAALLAELLAARGRQVLLVDAVPARASVHQELGIPGSPGFTDLPTGDKAVRRDLALLPRMADVLVLTAGHANGTALPQAAGHLARLAATDVECLVVAVSVERCADVSTVLADDAAGAVLLAVDGGISKRDLRQDAAALAGLGLDPLAVAVQVGSSSLARRRQARRRRGVAISPATGGG